MCKSNRGKRLVLFCLIISRNLLLPSPLGGTACGSVLFGSSFRCSDEHASPLCYWIFSLRLRKKDKCLIINSFLFLFLYAKHFGVAWEEGKLYMNNDLVLRVGFFKGISRVLFHSSLESPLSVLLQIFMGNFGCVGTAGSMVSGNFIRRMFVWSRYRGLKAYRTRIYECLNKLNMCLCVMSSICFVIEV